jgi:hypothetical protein
LTIITYRIYNISIFLAEASGRVEGKAIFRLIRAKVQHETKIQIEKRMCSAVRRFRIAKRAGGRKSDIPPDKSKSAARDEDPNGESECAARNEDSV